MILVGIDNCVKKWLYDYWIKTTKLSENKDDFLFLRKTKITETWNKLVSSISIFMYDKNTKIGRTKKSRRLKKRVQG